MTRKAILGIRVYFGNRVSRTYRLECKEIRGIKIIPDLLAYVPRLIGSIVEIILGLRVWEMKNRYEVVS